ncbi:unnamed protein product [Parascedosporium putredinis]|uniref:Uncharacterized protein n=1 Tax=Parascedosporium putredinis TaxID=1442378 RepID=A0A9P1H0Q0_9PEZI|nr:unnamed protein product [Parascedosporium putredinis]CAI7991954.1 unnamed protein product [Parascedosporium putredinis]
MEPPSNLATPLKQVWDHCLATYSDGLFGFKNYGWDQIMATKGFSSINVCVRWESSVSVTEAQRTQVAQTLNKQYQKWFQYLYGYDGFPFSEIKVNVVECCDWGQQVGREYYMNNLNTENIHILLHEIGHTYGLDDFYDWTPTGVSNFIMLAGSAAQVTEFDYWMLRNWWTELSRNRGWQTGSSNPTTTTTTPNDGAE